MSLLELLHNEPVVKLLEDINYTLSEILEEENDFSFIIPILILTLELLLQKYNKSNIAEIIYTMKKLQDLTEEKSIPEQKITEFLENTIIKQKKLNYGNN